MKQLYILIACSALLVGCSKDELTKEVIENDGYARLNVAFDVPSTRGQAAADDEKVLKSVAFFVETASGEFHPFFSHLDQLEHIRTDADGNITGASIRIGGIDPDGTAKIAVIGNYAENGLSDALAAVGSLQGLYSVQTRDITDAPIVSPFLAYLEPVRVAIAAGTTHSEDFVLKRVAARVDVTLTFWKIISDTEREIVAPGNIIGYAPQVRIFSPKTRSYLLPVADQDIAALPQAVGYEEPALTVNPENFALTYYTYENSEQEIAPLIIKVLYSGQGYRDMTLVLKDIDDKTVIRRNHYYHPEIDIVQAD